MAKEKEREKAIKSKLQKITICVFIVYSKALMGDVSVTLSALVGPLLDLEFRTSLIFQNLPNNRFGSDAIMKMSNQFTFLKMQFSDRDRGSHSKRVRLHQVSQ